MLKVGLTGGIGSGKSTAADFFRQHGIDVIDLDQVARDVVQRGSPALNEIKLRFGKDIISESDELDRQKLGKIVFENEVEKRWLESLLHPLINEEKDRQINNSKSAYIVIEIPLLAENQRQKTVDRVLVIDCDEKLQLERAVLRGHQTKEQIEKIIRQQASRDTRKALADDIIENNGTEDDLQKKLETLHQEYLKLASQYA